MCSSKYKGNSVQLPSQNDLFPFFLLKESISRASSFCELAGKQGSTDVFLVKFRSKEPTVLFLAFLYGKIT